MTGEELKRAGIQLFGERGWQSALAERLGVDRTQIWRYVTNDRVPGPVAAAVECWLQLRENGEGC
jgi:hypothetical protein